MQETQAVGDSTQTPGGTPEQDLQQKFETEKQDGIAYETYKKTVTEAKRAKEKASELEARLAEIERDKLSAQGKKDEVIESLRKQLGELENKHKISQASYTWNVVGAQIKSELAAKGVRNPDKALEYAKAVHKDDLSAIEVDSSYNVNKDDLSRFVDKFLTDNQDMGFMSKPSVKDVTPGKFEYGEKPKPLSELSEEELKAKWRDIKD